MYSFAEKLKFSRGVRQLTDMETIMNMIPGCVRVRKTDEQEDRDGIDYVATLRGNSEILIDAKAREAGCAKFWRNGPEFALEVWSIIPNDSYPDGKTGWTLSERKQTDYILFTFDPQDTVDCFLVAFQSLRMAFRKNLLSWCENYKYAPQISDSWKSACVFVPAKVVLQSITEISRGTLKAKYANDPMIKNILDNGGEVTELQ